MGKSNLLKHGKTLLAWLLVTTLLVGCATSTASSSKPVSGSASQTQNKEREKITIGIAQDPLVEDYETNKLTLQLEEKFNVDISFVTLPSGAEANTKFSLMVSSNSELPEILVMTLNDALVYDYASKGVLLETTNFLTNAELMPNLSALPEDVQSTMITTTRVADGKNYGFPVYTPNSWNGSKYRMWVYEPWLEKLNVPMPKTTEEFYEMCKAIATKDPNGDGKTNEVPIMGSKTGWGSDPFVYLMNAFTYANPDKNYFAVENGKVITAYTTDEWKQGLEFMNRLVKEKLLDPLSFTQDDKQMSALMTSNDNGMIGFVAAGSYSTFANSPITNEKMVLMQPLVGPNGENPISYSPPVAASYWYLTKDCKNPDLAAQIADYFYTEDMSITIRYGEKDVHWSNDSAVLETYVGQNEASMGIKPVIAILDDIWSKPSQNIMWRGFNPGYRSQEQTLAVGYDLKSEAGEVPGVASKYLADFYKFYVPRFPKETIAKLVYAPEELDKIANSKTAIDAYVYDMAIAFVTGQKNFSEWDAYIAELEKMGLEDYLAATQAAYDRSK